MGICCGKQEMNYYSMILTSCVMINPLMNDEFRNPAIKIVSSKSKIVEKVSIAKTVQIVTDKTASVIIDYNVVVEDGSVIIAMDNSNIYIGCQSCIGENTVISADGKSEIVIRKKVVLRKNEIIANGKSVINLEKKIVLA